MSPASPVDAPQGRSLSIPAYVGILVVYLIIVQVLGIVMAGVIDGEYGKFPDTESVLATLWVPVGASAVFMAGVVTWLGWWRPVMRDRDDIPAVPRWLWIVPGTMIFAIVAGMNYPDLIDRGLLYIVLSIIGALFIGFAEETTFRGVGVTAFRANGFSEPKVALWTCVLFGLAHGTNIFSEGLGAIPQVLVTAAAGFFLYLCRRLGRGLLLAILVHAFWDYALFSGTLGDEIYPLTLLFIVVDIVLVIVLLVRRRHLDLAGTAPAVT